MNGIQYSFPRIIRFCLSSQVPSFVDSVVSVVSFVWCGGIRHQILHSTGMTLSHKLQLCITFLKGLLRGQLVSIQREPISPIRHVYDGILMFKIAISNIILQKAWSV